MGLPRKLLGVDERIVLHLRTHGKALILPVLGLLAVGAVTAALIVVLPDGWEPWGYWVIAVLAVAGLVGLFVVPFLRWWTSTYTVTDRRVITRKGILNKSGHDLPLSRINNVTYERSVLDRMLGCGTLVLTTAAEAPLTLPDLPNVERVHVVMTELLFGNADAAAQAAVVDD